MNGENDRTILLVEDEVLIAMSEKKALESYKYKVIMAHTGEQAVELALTTPEIDLILMDINLGRGINGTEAAARILENRHLPVVFLSSYTDKETVELTEKITSYGYVVKNSGMTILDASIKMAFKLFEANEKFRTELTERKRAETVLQETLQTSADIVAAIPSGLFIYQFVPPDRLILLSANPEAERLTGLRFEQWKGRGFNEIWPEARNRGITDHYLTTMRTGVTFETEDLYYADERMSGAFRIRAFALPKSRLAVAFENVTERKRTEESLHESNERLRLAHKATNDVVWDWDIVRDAQMWNEAGTVVFGWTDIVQRPQTASWWMQRVHPEDRQRVDKSFFAVVDNPAQNRWQDEYRFLKADGTYAQVMDRGYVLRDAQGKAIRMIGAMLDISARKRAEDALRESAALLDDTQQLAKIGGWEWDVARQTMTWTAETYRIYGFAPNEIQPRSQEHIQRSLACYNPNDRPIIEAAFWRCVTEGKPYNLEFLLTVVNGRRIWIQTTAKPFFNDGKVVKIIGNIIDITERKQTEEALRESEEKHRALVEGLPDIVMRFDRDGRHLFVSDNVVDVTDIQATEFLGKTHREMNFPEPLCTYWEESIRRVFDSAAPFETEFTFESPHGEIIFNWRLLPELDAEGKVQFVLSVSQDITERKRYEETIQQQIKEKEVLLKEVHHRIKNNIASIESLLSMQSQSVNAPEALSVLQDAISRVRSMGVLYEKLLLSTRYHELATQAYLEALTDAIIAIFPNTAGVKFTTRIENFLLDTERLFVVGIVVNELLTNSMKYAFVGRGAGILQVTLTKAAQHVTLTVQDNGQGFAKGEHDDLSRGFGLQIIDMLRKQVSGKFTIEHENGTKAIFEFDI